MMWQSPGERLKQLCRYRDGENPGRDGRYYNPGWSDNHTCSAWMMERIPEVSEANNKTRRRSSCYNPKIHSRGFRERFRVNQNRIHSKNGSMSFLKKSIHHQWGRMTQNHAHELYKLTWIRYNIAVFVNQYVWLSTQGRSIRQFNIDTVMPDPDPASPAFIKERRYRFAFKKWAYLVRDDALLWTDSDSFSKFLCRIHVTLLIFNWNYRRQ